MATANQYSPFGLPSAGVSADNPLAPEYLALERQKKIADLLMQKGQQLPEGQMVSGHYVAPSFTQQLGTLANAYMGGNMAEQNEAKTAKLADLLRGQNTAEAQDILSSLKGSADYKPATMPQIQRDDMGNLMPQISQTGSAPNPQEALLKAINSRGSFGQALAPQLVSNMFKEETPLVLPEGATAINRKGEVIATGKLKEEKPPVSYQEYQLAKKEGFTGSYNDYQTLEANRKRPVTHVYTGDTTTNQLSSAFLGQAKPYIEVAQAYRKVLSAPESAAGDMSKIFGYMKILDPGSTVREGEAASAQNAAGVPDRILNLYNKALTGQRLNPTQRADFDNSAYKLVESQKQQFEGLKTHFKERAISQNANPNNVIYDPFKDIAPYKSPEIVKKEEVKGTGRGNPFKPTAPKVVDFNSLPSGG
jgi:hypothetical protein